ncbi:MAG TPA: FAD:protein FMN transferase [Candidatus Limnocylindrales bacterium]|nr:FAD:protein FMN transferase [Candidatus Limnocylindrales bacterium]
MAAGRSPASGPLRRVETVMGTVASFDVRDPAADPDRRPAAAMAIDRAVAWLHDVDRRFSPYRPDSQVSRIAAGTLAEVDADADLRAVLELADALAIDSDGAFDVRRWQPDGRLDPSGIVKGWAIDAAAAILADAGCSTFAIGAGGDLVARGGGEPDRGWRVGIRHPDRPDRVAAVLTVPDAAIATSAAYERGAHIRDPRSGRVPDGVRSMTVVGPSLTWADAYATAGYVLGNDGLDWIAAHDGYAALSIGWDDRIRWSAGLDSLLVR